MAERRFSVYDFYFALKRAENSLIDPLRMHSLIASKYIMVHFFCPKKGPDSSLTGKTQNTEKDLLWDTKHHQIDVNVPFDTRWISNGKMTHRSHNFWQISQSGTEFTGSHLTRNILLWEWAVPVFFLLWRRLNIVRLCKHNDNAFDTCHCHVLGCSQIFSCHGEFLMLRGKILRMFKRKRKKHKKFV